MLFRGGILRAVNETTGKASKNDNVPKSYSNAASKSTFARQRVDNKIE